MTSERTSRLAAWSIPLLAAATLLLGFARHAPYWDRPWDRGIGTECAAWYQGAPIRAWKWLGFAETRGVPYLGALPSTPPVGVSYLHHPPAFPWLLHAWTSALGMSERSFRMLPILFSSLTGSLVVLLAASRGGFRLAAAAAVLWLVLPMSLLYGSMPSPESPVLFFIVLTFWLHDRFRTAGFWAYAPALLSQGLAVQMDWQGAFALPALFLYELSRPRGDRRLRRVVSLGFAALLSALVVLSVHGYLSLVSERSLEMARAGVTGPAPAFEAGSIPRYLALGFEHARRVSAGSLEARLEGSAADWWGRRQRDVTDMFTWPAAVAVAAAFPLSWFRRSDALRLGLCLVLPGVLNVVVFRLHADHEFWTYHATAGVALVVPEAARLIGRSWIAGTILVAVVAAFGVHRVDQRLSAWSTTEFRDVGREIDTLAEDPDELLVCDARFHLSTFYMRPQALAKNLTLEELQLIVELRKAGRIPNPVAFVLAPRERGVWLEKFHAALEASGRVRRLDPPEVAASLPVTARTTAAGPVWVLRID